MPINAASLDVNSIVSQLMTVERQPINKLNVKEAGYQAKLSAFGNVKGAVSSFQTALQGMVSASNFLSFKAISSDAAIFSATATSSATAGTYSLEVTSLAQTQKLVAAGQASSTAAIGAGAATTVTFDFGTISGGTFDTVTGKYTGATFAASGNATKSLTIDSSNNSLQGIRDAINAAQLGITATIINDGSGTPYRLALSSNNAGVSNSMKISVSGDAAVSSLLAHNPASTQNMAETAAASNANFKVNGVAVSKTSNTVSDVIQGVTLTLNKITTTPATLTVARDSTAVGTLVATFVKSYNDLATTLKNASAYNPATKQGAILQGDSTVRSLQAQLRSMLSTSVVGTTGVLTMLSDVGVSFQKDGTLALNQSKLDSAMSSNFSDIASLFAAVGKGTDSLVNFSSATSTAKAGNYPINVSQLATQGKMSGVLAVGTSTVGASNNTFSVNINGVSAAITLPSATYTHAALATELQSQINSASAFSAVGITVAATQSSGIFSISSNTYGATSSVTLTGTGADNLFGGIGGAAPATPPTTTLGVNVIGTIAGVAATGSGQMLTATSGDQNGLSITVTGGSLGTRGTLNYSQGYAATLKSWATSILANDGALSSRTDGIGRTIADIDKQRDAIETRLINIEKRYRAQFTALDQTLSGMNTTSTYLTQQLAQISNLR